MFSSSAADARPVRIELNSCTVCSTDWSIRWIESVIRSSIIEGSLAGGDERAHVLARDDALDVAVGELEDVDRQVVVHAERESGRVHDLETLLDRLQMRDGGQEDGRRV